MDTEVAATGIRRPSRTADALALAEETLSLLETENGPVAPMVRRCLRLTRMVPSWEEAAKWFRGELQGYGPDAFGDENWGQYAAWSGREIPGTRTSDTANYWPEPIEKVELNLELALDAIRVTQPPTSPVPEPAERVAWYSSSGQTAHERVIAHAETTRMLKEPEIRRWHNIVSTLRGAMHDWLSRVVVQLRYGSIVDNAFDRMKARFDDLLSSHAPAAGRALAAAFRRADSGDSEEWSQALTSCRRALKALADSLYPATDAQPTGHELTEPNYKNRLIQFVSERLTSGSLRDLTVTNVESVADRADALNELASKGVHSDVSEKDLELTVVRTYLLAGEVLELQAADSQ